MHKRTEPVNSEHVRVAPYRFDCNVYYHFGGKEDEGSRADNVYRAVPIYNESVLRKIKQSVATGAAKRNSVVEDVGAEVPKAPVVRKLFVDAVTRDPIGDGKKKNLNIGEFKGIIKLLINL